MKKFLLLLFIAGLMIACKKAQIEHTQDTSVGIPWADTSSKHPKDAQFKALLEKYRLKGMPGISLIINDPNGTWVGSTGMADIIKNIPFRPGQVSKAASITKLLVGTLVFKLMEDSVNSHLGYNDLYQPVSKWLPSSITNKLPNGDLVTLGQCMKHETGIPDLIDESKFYLAVLNNPNRIWHQEDLLEFIYDKDPLFAPGDTAIYSNTNTVIVSMIIEAATKRNHSDLLHELILTPLGMTQTFYQPHDELPSNTAQGYYDLYNNGTIVNVSNLVTGSGNGYGGIYSNIFDLYNFADRLLVKQNLLTAKSLNLMMTFGKPDGINRYGYGIMRKFIDREPDAGLGHSGRDVGYSANLFYFPAKKVLHVFFINYGTDGDSKLKQVFLDFQEELLDITLN
jgi:D-alanyl-D-alanine carboxypeptidase